MMSSKSKTVSKKAWETWPAELRAEFEFAITGDKVTRATCKVCQKHVEKIKSVYHGQLLLDVRKYGEEGTHWILRPNLERHLKSAGHVKCKELETGMTSDSSQRSMSIFIGPARKRAIAGIAPLMRVALHIARKEMPLSAFVDEIQLSIDNGCLISGKYNNRNGCKTMINSLANQLGHSLRQSLGSESNFFGWMVDGSTVNKRKLTYESELMYIRTAVGLVPKVQQYDLVSMQEYASVSAHNLYHASLRSISSLFREDPTTIDTTISDLEDLVKPHIMKLIGIGADGAAVNFGVHNGLLTRWSDMADWLVKIHCYSHRMELAAKDALSPHYGHVDEFLQQLYYHFRNSPKEWACLNGVADRLSMQLLTMPKCFGTRFVSHRKDGMHALMTNWVGLVTHFGNSYETEQNEKALGYLAQLMNFEFYLECSQYNDILSWLSQTSEAMQSEADRMNILDASNQIQSLQRRLSATSSCGGVFEHDAIERLRHGFVVSASDVFGRSSRRHVNEYRKIAIPYKRITGGRKPVEMHENLAFGSAAEEIVDKCKAKRETAISELRDSMSLRFEAISNNSDVLSKLKWLSHKSWISLNTPESQLQTESENATLLSDFGYDDISCLYERFKVPLQAAGCDSKTELLSEFQELKFSCQTPERRRLSTAEFWPTLYAENKNKYSHVFLLVEIIMCLPFSNAVVERGFSSVRRIMTDWRTSLGHGTIKDLLMISTRKGDLADRGVRERLIQATAKKFVESREQRGQKRKLSEPESPEHHIVVDSDTSEIDSHSD